MNLTDNAFAIGKSVVDDNQRYLKQIKPKLTPCIYGSHNVLVCHIEKTGSFMEFVFDGYERESAHLKEMNIKGKKEQIEKIYKLHAKGKSARQISKEVGLSHVTVSNYLKKREVEMPPVLVKDGKIESI